MSVSESLNRGTALAMGFKVPRRRTASQKKYVKESWSTVGNALSQSAAKVQKTTP
ncbi:hypothetical protein GCM10009720_20690 [Yaniella flava]|uniref:Uncharacterized protein n=1 Tax=Yaniella flava TaxID=287930 RepID=A0ABP5G529_9MICC